jgi:puromycin-sensitive aminopeptidase
MTHEIHDKNFRLRRSVLPARYEITLDIDMAGKRFTGRETISLRLEEPAQEIVLHANGLKVSRAVAHAGGAQKVAKEIEPVAVSETVRIAFAEPLPKGEVSLEVEWDGPFSQGLRGLYPAGKLAVTQFEAADARRLIPCFDEPAFKARWALTVKVPKGMVALGNGAVEKTAEEGDKQVVTFRETEVLSSYLVALVIGPIESSPEAKFRDIPVRTWAVPEKVALTAFGQEAALAALPRLEDYFGLPYAFGKLDQTGIPDFEAGAMENAGLITYREVALLLDKKTAPLSVQKRVAEVVTHELAHQWFGNWVTMVWWDDLWLNEAFATWMAFKVVDQWKPEWRIWLDFDGGKRSALALDALKSTHPIRGEVRNAEEAGEAFDLITYEKGGAVLRMIEGFLGAEKFRSGIRAYMKKHARANAVADDLWSALAEASNEPVLELANAWIRQGGFPLVSASLSGGKVSLSQRRFYSQPGAQSGETWPVPVVLRFSRGGKVHEQRVLFREAKVEVALEGSGEVEWLCANANATGFYRVAYEGGLLERLTGNLPSLAPVERIGLLSDAWARVRAGQLEIGTFLDLVAGFGGETDHAVLDELVGALGVVEHRLVPDADREALQKAVVALFGPSLAKVGYEAGAGEDDEVKLRRSALVRAVAGVGRDAAAVKELQARVRRVLAGEGGALDPNLLDVGVVVSARFGDASLFDALLAAFQKETDPAAKRRYLVALAAFEDPALAKRAQALSFTDTVPMQDISSFVSGLFANRAARDGYWDTLQSRWKDLLARTGGAPMLLRRVIEALGLLPERRHLEAVKAFLAQKPVEAAKQATAQTLERMEQDVSLRERAAPGVSAWVKRR